MRAPKSCSQEGCSTLTYDGASRCPEHHRRNGKWGPKVGTNRTATTAHKARRLRILRRDPMCQSGYAGCTGTSTICDHVIPLAAGGPDTDSNCQGVCRSCSDKKTSKEGHYLAGHNVEPRGRRRGIRRRVRRKRHHPNADDLVMRLSRDHPPDKRCPAASFPGP
jgi:5-methylcytosine-specific restriction enzyme A